VCDLETSRRGALYIYIYIYIYICIYIYDISSLRVKQLLSFGSVELCGLNNTVTRNISHS